MVDAVGGALIVVGTLVIGFGLLRALFEPSDDDGNRDALGWLGVLIATLAVIAAFYFLSPH